MEQGETKCIAQDEWAESLQLGSKVPMPLTNTSEWWLHNVILLTQPSY